EIRAEVAVAGVLEREAVQGTFVRTHAGEAVEHLNRPRVSVQQLAEVRLAKPRVDVGAGLDAENLGTPRRRAEAAGEVDLAVAPESDQPLDAVPGDRLRAQQDLAGRQQGSCDRSRGSPRAGRRLREPSLHGRSMSETSL